MKQYPTAFKESIVRKSLQLGGPSLASLAADHDLPLTTIYGWKKKYANQSVMTNSKKWTPEKKLEAIIEISSMSENEVGKFLRKNGLLSSDLEQWKNDFYERSSPHWDNTQKAPGRPKKDPELAKLQVSENRLKKELRRKEKALAEMAARVVLLKKSHEIFGGVEDDE